MRRIVLILALGLTLQQAVPGGAQTPSTTTPTGILNAGFVCTPGVFNSELMAPYDVLQHSIFRDSLNYVKPFIVTEEGKPFTTFEGIHMQAHYSFENAPRIDILVIPSTENSMGLDLENERYMTWLRQAVSEARWVVTLCDGAFPLAATGALNGKVATTFPGDREAFATMFPEVDVRYDVRFVVDGKFITSVGGAPSYEPAFYLMETLYSQEHARRSGEGLVVDWDLHAVPHLVIESQPGNDALQELRWLQGTWTRDSRRGEVLETWVWRGTGLYGESSMHLNGELQVTEHMRIERLGNDIYYTAKPRENAMPAMFRLISYEGGRFVFENRQHDFPQQILYSQDASGGLWARIEGVEAGEERGIDFRFTRKSK